MMLKREQIMTAGAVVAGGGVSGRHRPARTDVRRQIVAAAKEEFLARGYAGTNLRAVGARAGFTKGAVYSSFSSKEELLVEVLSSEFGRLARRVPEVGARPGAGWQEVAGAIADLVVTQISENLPLLRLVGEYATTLAAGRSAGGVFTGLRDQELGYVRELVESLTEDAGIHVPGDPEQMLEGVMALTMGYSLQRGATGDLPSVVDMRAGLMVQLHACHESPGCCVGRRASCGGGGDGMIGLKPPATRIDVHHHVLPDFYRSWLLDHDGEAGGLPIPAWSLSGSREVMAACSVRSALLSVSTPAVEPARGAEAAAIARDLNQYCHQLCVEQSGRYGYFATLVLPDVQRSLEELVRAYEELDADGVMLLANAKGTYLGDRALEPLMAELDRRRSVVFVHPSRLPGAAGPAGIPAYTADFLLDTTRAALNISRNGVLERYPNIRFVLPHGGGMIPYAAFRLSPSASPSGNAVDGLRRLRRFYYDTALTPSPFSMPALLRFAARGHVLFGSDYPYAPAKASALFARILAGYPSTRHRGINHASAERLFPRFARR